MKIKKCSSSSIFIATFTLWIVLGFWHWPTDSARNGKETSWRIENLLAKYQYFISTLKQSGR